MAILKPAPKVPWMLHYDGVQACSDGDQGDPVIGNSRRNIALADEVDHMQGQKFSCSKSKASPECTWPYTLVMT